VASSSQSFSIFRHLRLEFQPHAPSFTLCTPALRESGEQGFFERALLRYTWEDPLVWYTLKASLDLIASGRSCEAARVHEAAERASHPSPSMTLDDMSSDSVSYESPEPGAVSAEPDAVNANATDVASPAIVDEPDDESSEVVDCSDASMFESHMLDENKSTQNAAGDRLVSITTSDKETVLVRWTECDTWEVPETPDVTAS
jgi:hypothetical protein